MGRRSVVAGFVAGVVGVGVAFAAVPAAVSFAAEARPGAVRAVATERVVPAPTRTARATPVRRATTLSGWGAAPRRVKAAGVFRAHVRASGGVRVIRLERRLHGEWRRVDRVRTGRDGTADLAWRVPARAARPLLRIRVLHTATLRAKRSAPLRLALVAGPAPAATPAPTPTSTPSPSTPTPEPEPTAATPTAAPPTAAPSGTESIRRELFTLVNAARATPRTCGGTAYPAAAPLTRSDALDAAAGDYAALMAERDFFSHDGTDGSTMSSRLNAVGIRNVTMRENIAAGQRSAAEVMDGWLKSPGHCANLMAADVQRIGLGYAVGGSYGRYWVQDFAG